MTKEYSEIKGTILSCTGGLYCVKTIDGQLIKCKARGIFRNKKLKPICGDKCILRYENKTKEFFLFDIYERKTIMSRPEIANLEVLYITFSPISPSPDLFVIDKMIYNTIKAGIIPIIVITKSNLDASLSDYIFNIYSPNFKTYKTDSYDNFGIEELKNDFLSSQYEYFAFSGASGVGKSTLINKIFPALNLESGELSKKIQRGKNTTRTTELYEVTKNKYIADTPGFTSLSFEFETNLDSDEKSLNSAFPEIADLYKNCKWRNCTHTKEDGCAVLDGIRGGKIAKERYNSYIILSKGNKNY